MKDPIRLLTKDYFHRHPVKAFSAARLAYSMLLMPEVVTCLEDKLPELREMTALRGVQLPDSAQQKVLVEQEDDAGQLLRMLRRPLAPDACGALLRKLLLYGKVQRELFGMDLAALRRGERTLCPFHAVPCAWVPRRYCCHSVPHAAA